MYTVLSLAALHALLEFKSGQPKIMPHIVLLYIFNKCTIKTRKNAQPAITTAPPKSNPSEAPSEAPVHPIRLLK